MLKFRSVSSIVIAPAKTGSDVSRRIVVIKILHENKFIWMRLIDFCRIVMIVVMKLIDEMIDDAPAIWSEKIDISIALLLWNIEFDSGG